MARTPQTPPWKRRKPGAASGTPLSPQQKAAARQRAENAGRTYPNLVDNMWAAKLTPERLAALRLPASEAPVTPD